MPVTFSNFVRNVTVETAFNVLARAKELQAGGMDVVELEIGDSPFPTTPAAKQAGHDAIDADKTHYCPSVGLPEFREAASAFVNREYGLSTGPANIVAGPGAKVFELLFCELFLDPGDGVLVFSPYFPTYVPNIARRGARVRFSDLKQENEFRPNLDDVERPAVEPNEPDLVDCRFRPVEEILADLTGFETWSQICVRALFGEGAARGPKG